jgi:DNA end-binding protein Ku
MKLVDESGHALGREYHCSKDGKKLSQDELVRGYETDDGKMVVVTDEEFESVAPEMSGDIELRSFVPLEQIPPIYFNRPYFLAPSGKSTKAYHLLTATMEKAGRVGIGSFVMRGHEYLVAIIADNGVLRADTLRYADEVRTPDSIGLGKRGKAPAAKVTQFTKLIDDMKRSEIDLAELEDEEARALEKLAETKQKQDEDVIHRRGLEAADGDEGGAKVIDLMEVLRKSLSKNAVVKTAEHRAPISLDERRAQRDARKKPKPRKAPAKRKTAR